MDAKKILQRQREFDFNKVKTLDDLISVMRCLTLSIPMTDEQAEPIKHLLKDK